MTRLTDTGRKLAELPVDPRLGRMILAAGRNGCTREVLIITAALAIQDPRERPADAREAADAMHRRFAEPGSDFLAFLTLWEYLREQQRQLSSSAFRRLCRREYLHYLRVREWQDVYSQLQQAARDLGIVSRPEPQAGRPGAAAQPDRAGTGWEAPGGRPRQGPRRPGENRAGRGTGTARRATAEAAKRRSGGRYPADLADRIHQSLLAGLLSHIGMQDSDRKPADRKAADRKPLTAMPRRSRRRGPVEFAGARGARFAIFPDSPLARKPPPG